MRHLWFPDLFGKVFLINTIFEKKVEEIEKKLKIMNEAEEIEIEEVRKTTVKELEEKEQKKQ